MIASRVCTSATRPTTEWPAPSGPRCARARVSALSTAGSGGGARRRQHQPGDAAHQPAAISANAARQRATTGASACSRLPNLAPRRRQPAREPAILQHRPDRRRQPRRVLRRHQQPVAARVDQLERPGHRRRHHRPLRRERLDDHIAQRLDPARAHQHVARRQQRRLVRPPAQQMQPVRNPQLRAPAAPARPAPDPRPRSPHARPAAPAGPGPARRTPCCDAAAPAPAPPDPAAAGQGPRPSRSGAKFGR